MQLEKLVEVLSGIGKNPELRPFPDGSRALLLPYGGRILAGPVQSVERAKLFLEPSGARFGRFGAGALQQPGVADSGGDRTWLSPELDLFLPRYPDLNAYFQPRQLDPEDQRITWVDGEVRLCNRLESHSHGADRRSGSRSPKAPGPPPNSLRNDPES